jgi:hypothetical protein
MLSTPPPRAPAVARLVLDSEIGWPGAQACNSKTWANDCTTQMTAVINGTDVSLIPAVRQAFNEDCSPASGIVIGPKGTQAAVVFPQYPIGLTSTGPDGTFQIDFSQTAVDDPNGNDWSRCILTYRIVQGAFLDPRAAQAATLAAQQQAAAAAAAAAGEGEPERRQLASGAGAAAAQPLVATLAAGLAGLLGLAVL